MRKRNERKRRIINLDAAAGDNNPSSLHAAGVAAAHSLEEARETVSRALDARPAEIIFTSGGTEANNLAIFGVAHAVRHRVFKEHSVSRAHIITTVIEHASVLEPCRQLEREGCAVTYLPVNHDGMIDPEELAVALRPDTILVSIGYANNEIGVIQSLRVIAKIIRLFKKAISYKLEASPYFHTDACQALRFLDCRVSTLGVDLMTLNSGKIYGSSGVGCLYVRRGVKLQPILYGGGQERGWRSGTENVIAIAGFAQALEKSVKLRAKESIRLTKLRDYFIEKLLTISNTTLNGSATLRLPNNVNVSFANTDSEAIVLGLDAHGIAAASGSACSTLEKTASYVISAIGGAPESAVRLTFSRETTKRDLDYVLKILPGILARAQS